MLRPLSATTAAVTMYYCRLIAGMLRKIAAAIANAPVVNKMSSKKFRRLEGRVVKLTQVRQPRRFVFRYGEEAEAAAQGLPFALMPERCKTVQEWQESVARYASAGKAERGC
jgi:hypothetical protein